MPLRNIGCEAARLLPCPKPIASGPLNNLMPRGVPYSWKAFLMLLQTLRDTVPQPTLLWLADTSRLTFIFPRLFTWAGHMKPTGKSIILCLGNDIFKTSFIIQLEGRECMREGGERFSGMALNLFSAVSYDSRPSHHTQQNESMQPTGHIWIRW